MCAIEGTVSSTRCVHRQNMGAADRRRNCGRLSQLLWASVRYQTAAQPLGPCFSPSTSTSEQALSLWLQTGTDIARSLYRETHTASGATNVRYARPTSITFIGWRHAKLLFRVRGSASDTSCANSQESPTLDTSKIPWDWQLATAPRLRLAAVGYRCSGCVSASLADCCYVEGCRSRLSRSLCEPEAPDMCRSR